ncbi:MAG: cutinase family protein, partial [Frondihabitans sp.]|nr:cutinase family protein [Frondihabitans sp.]
MTLAVALAAGLIGSAQTNAHADASTGPGGLFVSNSARLWDTGSGTGGAPTSPLTANHWYAVGVDGVGGIPASGVSAVQVNFVVVNPVAAGGLHADKTGVATPNASVSYVSYGTATIANGGTIAVGSDGKIQVEVSTSAGLRIDVQGYYTAGATAAGGYVPVNATTVASLSQVSSNTYNDLAILGNGLVPSSASGVMLSISEANSTTSSGYIIAYPQGTSRSTDTLYWPAGENFAWSTAVALPSSGQITIYVGTGGPITLSVSVQGYFTREDGGSTAGAFTPGATRVYDSRSTASPIAAGDSGTIQVSGVNGVPSVGSGLGAVAVNIAILAPPGISGHVEAYPDDDEPGAQTQQFYAGTTSIFAIVPLGADGGISVQNSSGGAVNLVVDVEGWYHGLDPATTTCPGSIRDGSWALAPAAAMTCVITVPVAPAGGSIDVSVDGQAPTTVALSAASGTTIPVDIPSGAGEHSISSEVSSPGSKPTSDNTITFGSGNWSTASLIPNIPDGSNSDDISPNLWFTTDGAPITEATEIHYTISVHADLSNPVVVSSSTSGTFQVPDGTLTLGTTYFWGADIQGPNNYDGSPAKVTTPTWSFVDTTDPLLDPDTAAQSGTLRYSPDYASNTGCANVVVIALRGTGAPAGYTRDASNWTYEGGGGFGGIEHVLLNSLQHIGGLSVRGEAIQYPASAGSYPISVAIGALHLKDEMNALASICPSTKVWIIAHSQGAEAAGATLTFFGKLSKKAQTNFKGAVLDGDPTYRNNEAIDAPGNGSQSGKLYALRLAKSMDYILGTNMSGTSNLNLVRSYCFSNDRFCQLTGTSLDVHNSYGNK